MNPDDTNTNPLDAAYAVLLDMLRPDPVLRDATPAPWASATHEGAEL
jgi:hypothetical protein